MAAQTSNFDFLRQHDPLLADLGGLAERYFKSDPTTSLMKLRQFGEVLTQHVAACTSLYDSTDEKQFVLLNRLWDRGALTPQISQLFHGIRKAGNAANHENKGDHSEALHQLKMAYKLSIWFYKSFGNDSHFRSGPFIPPPDPQQTTKTVTLELERLREELVASQSAAETAQAVAEAEAQKLLSLEERLQQETEEKAVWEQIAQESEEAKQHLAQKLEQLQTQASIQPEITKQAVIERAKKVGQQVALNEAETRHLIDQQLAQAGWTVDSQELTYANGVRPQKNSNMAIAEWPVRGGRVDYVLFAGLQVVGVVEAKRKRKDVPAALEQSKRYSRDYVIKSDEVFLKDSPWDNYKIPFLFATNGRPFLQQLRTQSGIWFLDTRRPDNISRPLTDWYTPEGLQARLKQDHDTAHERLKTEPTDYLGLRGYQIKAIYAVEAALAEDQRKCLLAMATGTGKTRTCIGLIYRLLKTRRFRRVLFLVDRRALGEQAANAFKEARLENLQTFTDIFETLELGDNQLETDTKLHISTVQGMVKRIMYPTKDDDCPPIDLYDCIVVDESHRGYNLDRDLSDTELLFRDQKSYISKYRRVLEHFDAVKIGLTATPALHTTEIFGEPVYQYSYREAVIDGWLVDHNPPYQIKTKLGEEGMHWAVGESMTIYKTRTQEVDTVHLEDEVDVELESYNKKVITENFNRVVCQALTDYIDPSLPENGKTLIFCANDMHADLVVDLLKQALQNKYGQIEDDAVVKITGTSDKPLQLIRRYRNERLPNIAVTVDLLTTGIDVPSICNLVFIRRVRSRILYEQMMGRATRLCPDIEKESFHIFDAVDIYSALEPYTSMKPVVSNPKLSFKQLYDELTSPENAEPPEILREIHDQFIAKLQRKSRHIKGEALEHFEAIAKMPLADFMTQIQEQTPVELTEWFKEHPKLPRFLDTIKGKGNYFIISDHEDELLGVTRGYGQDGEDVRPEDYLEGFNQYIQENMNAIPALLTVLQRPRDLTREQLKDLKMELDAAGYSERALQTAWRQQTNQDIAASIIGFIRQQALHEPLKPYEERVSSALTKILSSRSWTDPQRKWLQRIGKQLTANVVVDKTALDSGEFKKQAGGFTRLNKVFDGQLEEILADINEALWEDAG